MEIIIKDDLISMATNLIDLESILNKGENTVRINFNNLKHVSPWIYSLISNWYTHLKENGYKISFKIINAQEDVLKYASRMNFFRYIEYDFKEDFNRHNPRGKFFPIKNFAKYDADLSSEITEVICRKCNIDINSTNGQNQLYMLEYCLNELIENVDRHAFSQNGGFVVVQSFDRLGKVEVCITDMGIGIPGSLRKTDKYKNWNSETCVRNSTEKNVKTDCGEGQGNGLYILKRLITFAGGELEILSDNGYYKYEADNNRGNEKLLTLDCKWVGTIIKFEYNYKSDIDLNEVIDDIEYIPYSKLLEDMKENRDFIDGYLGISN